MARDQVVRLGRRRVLQGLGAVSLSLGGGSLLAGCATQAAPFFATSSGDTLETTSLRLFRSASLCHTPQLMAEPLLRAEGFTDVRYFEPGSSASSCCHGRPRRRRTGSVPRSSRA